MSSRHLVVFILCVIRVLNCHTEVVNWQLEIVRSRDIVYSIIRTLVSFIFMQPWWWSLFEIETCSWLTLPYVIKVVLRLTLNFIEIPLLTNLWRRADSHLLKYYATFDTANSQPFGQVMIHIEIIKIFICISHNISCKLCLQWWLHIRIEVFFYGWEKPRHMGTSHIDGNFYTET
jgi:hypothetical protein